MTRTTNLLSRALTISGAALLLAGAAALTPTGCTSSSGSKSAAQTTTTSASDNAEHFATPDGAVDALITAVRAADMDRLTKILGDQADDVLASGDEVADANGRAEFLRLYDEKHSIVPTTPGATDSMTLNAGATDWPCPIPIVKDDRGWYFDTDEGLDELLSRRIGRNELSAIQSCLAIVDAERDYAASDYDGNGWREYARTFRSDEGKKNGLYWPAAPGQPQSPLGELFTKASGEGYGAGGETKGASDIGGPYHGYYYRILTSQGAAAPGGEIDFVAKDHMIGGFGVVAWPADYANSGLKTFITSHHGVVYEKDLGDDTDKLARAMTSFDPGEGWQPCKDTTPVK